MSDDKKPSVGSIAWTDLTVPNAEAIRDFYKHVVGWESSPISMGDYDDYCMTPPGSERAVAGVCHTRGPNAKQPPYWLIYVVVQSVKASADRCVELGGKLIDGPRKVGDDFFCVIQDPAGAFMGLYGPA